MGRICNALAKLLRIKTDNENGQGIQREEIQRELEQMELESREYKQRARREAIENISSIRDNLLALTEHEPLLNREFDFTDKRGERRKLKIKTENKGAHYEGEVKLCAIEGSELSCLKFSVTGNRAVISPIETLNTRDGNFRRRGYGYFINIVFEEISKVLGANNAYAWLSSNDAWLRYMQIPFYEDSGYTVSFDNNDQTQDGSAVKILN